MNQTSAHVETDKPYYQIGMQQGTIVYIHGLVPTLPNGTVTVSVKSPYGMYKTLTVHTDRSGSFSLPYIVDVNAPIGTYVVTADYKGGEVSVSFYVMRG
ncbi:MAG: hypothetical protein KGI25_08465 [Thaumarchaeota archaeon]|nr:hypothetical protein [Nitrososphaerota archaeon]